MFSATSAPATRTFARSALRAFLLGCMLLAQPAMADLMLHPTRLVFEKNQRATQVDLINNGTESATYRISLVNMRMAPTGELANVTAPLPGEQFADGMLVFSPRQVTLAPGTTQTVRVMVRRPASIVPGEYRSHLYFERLPNATGQNSVETAGTADGKIGIVLNVLVGASIPVIVRQGDSDATVALSHVALEAPPGAPPALALQLDRSGNYSVYGDLTVSFAPNGGSETEVGRAGGIAVYPPNPTRLARVALVAPKGVALAHGVLHVTYRERPDAGGKLLAESSLVLP